MSQGITFFTTGIHRGIIYIDDLMEFEEEIEESSSELFAKLDNTSSNDLQYHPLSGVMAEVDTVISSIDDDEMEDELNNFKSELSSVESCGLSSVAFVEEDSYVTSRYWQHIYAELNLLNKLSSESGCDLANVTNSGELSPSEMTYYEPLDWASKLDGLIEVASSADEVVFENGKKALLEELSELKESLVEAQGKSLKFCLCYG